MSLIIPLLFSLFISSSITIYTWRRRELPGALFFTVFMALGTALVLSQMLESLTDNFVIKLFWEKVEFSVMIWIPTAWALFAWQYANYPKRPFRCTIIILSIIPLLFTFLIWNAQTESLFWSSITLDDNQFFLNPEYAILSWALLIYANLLLLIGVLFLINVFFRSPHYYSKQVIALLIGIIIPWLAFMLYIWQVVPFNPISLVVSISGIIIYWGFYRAGLFEITPIAQTSVIENLHDGIIVLDLQDRIVDINPAAKKLIAWEQIKPIGKSLNDVFEVGFTLIQELNQSIIQDVPLTVKDKQLACSLTLLSNRRGEVNGRLLTLRDITETSQTATQLQNYTQRLQLLHNIDRAILSVQQAEKIATITLKHIRQIVPILRASVFLFNDQLNEACSLTIDESTNLSIKKGKYTQILLADTDRLRQLKKGEIYQKDNLHLASNLSSIEHQFKNVGINQLLNFPLIVQGKLVGSLNLGLREEIKAEHRMLVKEVADALAVALQHAQLYEQERNQKELAQTFYEINQALTSSLDQQHVLELILEELANIITYDSASIMLLEKGILTSIAYRSIHKGKKGFRQIQASDFEHLQAVIESQYPLIIPNTRNDPRWKTLPTTTSIHSWLGVPLIQNKQVIGLLNITKAESDYYHEQASQTALIFASQAVTAITNARLYESERLARRQEEILRDAITATAKTLQLDVILPTFLNYLQKLVPYDSAGVMLLEDDDQLSMCAIRGYENWIDIQQYKETLYKIKSMEGFQIIFDTKKPLIIPDTTAFDGWVHHYGNQYIIRSWLGVPLVVSDKVIGILSLDKQTPHFFSTDHIQVIKALAASTAVSIQNARLYESEKQAHHQEETLRAANIALTKNLDLNEVLSTILDYTKHLVPYDGASVMLIKGSKVGMIAMRGYEQWTSEEQVRSYQYDLHEIASFKQLFETKQGFIISDTNEYDGWVTSSKENIIRSWLGVPLMAAGTVIGFFSISKQKPNFFTPVHLQTIAALAAQAAIAIQNAQLYQETQYRTSQLEALTDLSTVLRASESVDQMIAAMLEKVISLTDGSYGGVYLMEKDADHLILHSTFPSIHELDRMQHKVNIGVIGHVATHGEVYIVKNIADDPIIHLFEQEKDIMISMVCGVNLPLRAQEQIVGVIYIYMTQAHTFTDTEVQLLTAVSEIAGSAIHRALILDTLEQRVDKRTHALAIANERLLELDKLKTKFVADVSHELRTPVTNLQLYLDLFAHVSPEKQEKYLAILQTQSARLALLIKDILTLSKFDAEAIQLQFSEVDFNEIIRLIVSAQTPRIEKANLQVKLALEEPLPTIFASANQIKQVVSNLLANAINYAEQGTILLETSLSADKHDIYFWIQDSGPGILPEDVIHIFDRFYRGKPHAARNNKPGTGLGLAIVKEIIIAHKGEINVKSNGSGTTFTIQLPVYEL